MTRALTLRALLFAIVLYSIVALALPQSARAVGFEADAQCVPAKPVCGCGFFPDSKGNCTVPGNKYLCTCIDVTNGKTTTGFCQADQRCHATNAPGLSGGNALDQGLSQLGQQLGQLMSKLMSGGGSGGGSGSGSTPGVNTTPTCNAQPTSDINTYQSNPQCFYYVPPVSASLGANSTGTSISDMLLNGLGATTTDSNTNTNTNTNISDQLTQTTDSSPSASTTVTVNATTTGPVLSVPTNAANLLPGIRGDIQVFSSGATILGGQRDTTSNSETSGFFGANTFNGAQPTGIVASLCQARPWASGLFSKLVPSTFFDGLCSLRGYQVGAPQQVTTAPQVTVSQTPAKPAAKPAASTPATTTITVEPKVDIWAVPTKVSLGSRTSIFWNTQGVSQCTETSPDGSFSQTSLSGGASTVPITADTTFTISCLAPDGSHVSDYVTVNLAI